MEKSDAYRKGTGSSKKWDGGGPGGPGSGPYGGGGPRGPPRGLDNVRGIDHSKFSDLKLHLFFFFGRDLNLNCYANNAGSLPACGSCCGG